MSGIPPVAPPANTPPAGADPSKPDAAAFSKAIAVGAMSVLGGMMFQMLNTTKSNGEEDAG